MAVVACVLNAVAAAMWLVNYQIDHDVKRFFLAAAHIVLALVFGLRMTGL